MLIKKDFNSRRKIYNEFIDALNGLRRERAAAMLSFREALEKRKINSVLDEIKKL